jgi:hypothetical protein
LDAQNWPKGDANAIGRLPESKQKALDLIVEAGFDGNTYGGRSWGIIVVKDGRIVAERYAMGFDMHQAAQTHSAAKSFASSLVGIATRKYGLNLDRPGALQEWHKPGAALGIPGLFTKPSDYSHGNLEGLLDRHRASG